MLYHLIFPLRIYFSPLNVLGYITFRSILAVFVSLIISFVFGRRFISYLNGLKVFQAIRSDGPQTHMSKSGIPTMGGVIILVSLLGSTLICGRLDNRFVLWSMGCVLWFGMLGFIDDYLKVIKKNPKGLNPNLKLYGQMLFAAAVCIYLCYYPANERFMTIINIPYLKGAYLDLGVIVYMLFVALIIIGSSNAVNLTDGLDGLAVGCLTVASFSYVIFAYLAGHAKLSQYLKIIPVSGAGELTVFLMALVGSGLGFLWFNGYPAEIFMGDTGSLFLGGAIGLIAVFVKQELVLVVVGGIFVVEVLSVILQVSYFRRYKKRIFRMAPLHHHFELFGWAEPKVTVRFWIIAIILSLVALSSLKLR
jgi:phospho-N-acetylmuramoyl-pentapeptide-transferase